MTLLRVVTFFGQPVAFACDGKCNKAWGINQRPKHQLSTDDDDIEYLADYELGDAPTDPGTYEGGDGKPVNEVDRMNRWCIRECERSVSAELGEPTRLKNFESRVRNIPSPQEQP